MKIITTRSNQKYLDENGILRIKILEGAHIDLEAIKENHQAEYELTGHKKVLALCNACAFFTITCEARNFVKKEVTDKTRLATAVLADQVAVRILVNGFIRINKPKSPTKMFTCKEEALKWLMDFKKQIKQPE